MKTPTLEEVKEYFKDADKIQSIIGRKFKNDGNFRGSKYAMDGDTSIYAKKGKYEVWNQLKGYAKILSYKKPKEETFLITKDQIKEIHGYCNSTELQNTVKEWFPSAFKTELPKDFTGWAKTKQKDNERWLMCFEKGILKYGFNSMGEWHTPTIKGHPIESKDYEATNQEVEEALKNEAFKRGFKRDVIIVDIYNSKSEKDKVRISNNIFEWEPIGGGKNQGQMALRDSYGNILFHNGIWATIIQQKPMTKEQIEKELGYNIEII